MSNVITAPRAWLLGLRLNAIFFPSGDQLRSRGKFLKQRSDAQDGFVATVEVGAQQPSLAYVRIVSANVGHAMAVGRERDVAINVAHHHLGRAAQHGRAIEDPIHSA